MSFLKDVIASPRKFIENIYLDDPTGSWTLSTYTTGAPTGTLIFNGGNMSNKKSTSNASNAKLGATSYKQAKFLTSDSYITVFGGSARRR